jgi:hypothetical protein
MLQEVGFIAGQHEVLSETFTKDNYKMIQEQVGHDGYTFVWAGSGSTLVDLSLHQPKVESSSPGARMGENVAKHSF